MSGEPGHATKQAFGLDNVGLVRAGLDAVSKQDPEAIIRLMHPGIEFVPIFAALEGKVYTAPARSPTATRR